MEPMLSRFVWSRFRADKARCAQASDGAADFDDGDVDSSIGAWLARNSEALQGLLT